MLKFVEKVSKMKQDNIQDMIARRRSTIIVNTHNSGESSTQNKYIINPSN
jgi:hypothetical protein